MDPAPFKPEIAAASPAATDEPRPLTTGVPSKWHQIVVWYGIIGGTASLIALPLAYYLYAASKVKPLLTFSVHPLKTELQRPDNDKALGFTYAGKPVGSDIITSVQVSLWNAGTRSIWERDVLQPIYLVMPEGAEILSARVKKVNRTICGFERIIDEGEYKSGKCHLKWRILEPDDGAVVQIIYAGGTREDPKLEGIVEGQKGGVVVEKYSLNYDRTTIIPNLSITNLLAVVSLIAIAIFLIWVAQKTTANTEHGKQLAEANLAAQRRYAELSKSAPRTQPIVWLNLLGALLLLVTASVLFFISLRFTGPPFGW